MSLNLPHRTRSKPGAKLLDLSNELIILAFEYLLLSDIGQVHGDPFDALSFDPYKAMPIIRVVCKRFHRLATPIRYRYFTLQPPRWIRARRRPQPRKVRKAVAEDVRRFTEHVVVQGKINWHRAVRNYASLPRLKTISWRFYAPQEGWIGSNLRPIPTSILRTGVTVEISGTGYYHDIISLIPAEYVSALFLGYWHPAHPRDIDAHDAHDVEYNPRFKEYLLQAKNLVELDYDLAEVSDTYGGAAPSFPAFLPEEKMPPLKRLVLTGYRWLHTKEEAKLSWDFSKVEHLDITGMNISSFFVSVETKWFSNLRSLKIGTFVWRCPSNPAHLSRKLLLHTFLRSVPQLEHLSMNAYTQDFPLDILMAMENLRLLKFTEEILFYGQPAVRPRLDMQDLEELLLYLPHLERLCIDFEPWSGDFKRKLCDTICQFPALKYIHINDHGTNTDSRVYDFPDLEQVDSTKIVTFYSGQYVNFHVNPWYDDDNMQWDKCISAQWVVPGKP